MTVDRRKMLAGLAGLPLAAAALPALAAAPEPEPIVELRRRFVDHMATADRHLEAVDLTDADGEAADAAINAALDLQDESADLPVATMAGALAALQWGRDEFARFHVQEPDKPDGTDVWTLAMMDRAIGVLRQAVEGGARA